MRHLEGERRKEGKDIFISHERVCMLERKLSYVNLCAHERKKGEIGKKVFSSHRSVYYKERSVHSNFSYLERENILVTEAQIFSLFLH